MPDAPLPEGQGLDFDRNFFHKSKTSVKTTKLHRYQTYDPLFYGQQTLKPLKLSIQPAFNVHKLQPTQRKLLTSQYIRAPPGAFKT